MDVLVLSCGTGGGHDAAAGAVADEMTRRGHHAVLLNPYTLHSRQLAETINRIYIAAARKAPRAYGAAYSAAQLYRRLPFNSPVYFANRCMTSVMEEYLAENHFDIIITPHLFPAEIVTAMKHKGLVPPKTIFIATDYACIPFTEDTECDAYVIPSSSLAKEYTERGIPLEKLHPLGIPVHRRFLQEETRSEARLRLGLDPNRKYVLIAGGSMGGGRIRKVIRILMEETAGCSDMELIIICGSNKKLLNELKTCSRPGITALGFTDDMAGYLRASDLFVTKPGGLSSTEAAVSHIPIIHVAEIPGCETSNAEYFSSHGMSLTCGVSRNSLRSVIKIVNDPSACSTMIQNQAEMIPADSTAHICTLAENMTAVREHSNLPFAELIRPAIP